MNNTNLTRIMCGIGLAIAGGLLAAPPALAHEGMMDHDMMEKIDANHDGMISAQEHADYARTMFDRMDANHDGMLSKSELESAHGMHHEHEDGDEHEKHEHDASDEHEKHEHEDHEKHEHEEHEHEEHEHEEHEHGDSKGMHHDMMATMDNNHDGMISAAEHAEHMKAMFDQADANHDGMLSKDEIRAAHEMREEKHEQHEDKKG